VQFASDSGVTTFRLTIEQADLVAAMQAMIASLQEQTGAQILFNYVIVSKCSPCSVC
jgi:nitrate/nitrite-specific signal transduction histidine kinase